ncbi:nicotinate-nucleotide adenylyltransferase [Simiduia aestuariiviva]|uniref:Probable nicotinate-nucleotide adenylyltransferase n=1 Tax=Simiduia aestuariiviva TaxID=1510459 RepID=A0A839URD7_9GAMM|nr:nicotinate-nucleotide adenylyltransferase [Simiduia aestuariiviva]
MKRIGVLGGTFDPIHLGHLTHAEQVREQLALDEMRLMPAHIPPHRASPQVDAVERAQLVRLALTDYPQLTLDERELGRQKPSYTVDSLAALRAESGPTVGLYFVMGMDSLCAINQWHQWQQLIELANLVILARPEVAPPAPGSEVGRFVQDFGCTRAALLARPHGGIWMMDALHLPVSATDIRAALAAGRSARQWLTPAVADYVEAHKLYVALADERHS